jgi:glucokinase
VGIGAPGVVDIDKGVVIKAVNLRWNDFPLARELRRELDLEVTLDNDVNVATWGEYVAGVGDKYPDMLGVWVGTGIGGGLILGGKLYHGHHQTAGEIGHVTIHADAPLGRRTLENCASRTSITNLITQLINSNHASKITKLVDGDLSAIRSKILAQAVDLDDRLAKDVIGQAARYVGITIANAVTLLSLPCAVVGGGFTEAMDRQWVDAVRASFEEYVFPDELRSCKILRSELGDDAGAIGAALLAQERVGGGGKA